MADPIFEGRISAAFERKQAAKNALGDLAQNLRVKEFLEADEAYCVLILVRLAETEAEDEIAESLAKLMPHGSDATH